MLPKRILGFEQMQNFLVEFQGVLVFSLGISRCETIFQNFKPGMQLSKKKTRRVEVMEFPGVLKKKQVNFPDVN